MPADRDPWDPMPPLARSLLLARCPVCGARWLAGIWAGLIYSAHYATVHLGLSPWRLP